MRPMTEHRPHLAVQHDYIPAAGRDALLPGYDLLTRLLGMNTVYDTLVAQADAAMYDAKRDGGDAARLAA